MAVGRFAPSPTGELHIGNLRTALLAWLFARAEGSAFLVRVEDLDDRVADRAHEAGQLADLRAIGLDWDGDVVRQSERRELYDAAIDRLVAGGLTYECTCTRREIREAASAAHGEAPEGAYPGTCRRLDAAERARRAAEGRPAALRLDAQVASITFVDRVHGPYEGLVDDVVLRRNDGVPAYNLAVVVDDADQGVEEVVRGDDLLSSTPRQLHLADLLHAPRPAHAHVPLVLGPDGKRMAKRHGAVTLADRAAQGETPALVLSHLATSLGLAEPGELLTPGELVDRFDPTTLPRQPWIVDPDQL
ncbi:tRNA glutamyl-Q(34) synthetase GluQRS [Actinomarinicola tropica]|uniref:Glutamyl-Q tRNA(Asp) synthetase n=1 Tax=Actinomarinicola tropica TaxID=2789776 RepID=A0A5Q2RM61_9ACTN|nr:tRNA glutamyl-Q(34) synthetase GluQRS [Actinomarinicola tropica]QGG96032.1 tRNA glutamyl-Q(34) synthetase GluQRS [Actinomarinicola tropica]